MKIVIDIRDMQLDRVGVSVYCENVVNQILKMRDEYQNIKFVFIASDRMKKLKLKLKDIELLYIAPSVNDSLIKKIFWYIKLPKVLKELDADLFFGSFQKIPFLKFPCKTVYTLHDAASITETDMISGVFSKYKNKFFVKNWIDEADGVICISNFCLEEFSKIIDSNLSQKSKVIYHGLPKELEIINNNETIKYEKPKYMKEDSKYIVVVGTVYPKKNIQKLIESMVFMDDNIKLLVCGQAGTNSDEIYLTPKLCGLEKRVLFLGRVSNTDLKNILYFSDIFVFPSLYEGFGIPLLEAFYMKIPVVCSNATCLPEIAGDAALYFDPYNVKDIAEKVSLMMNDEKLKEDYISRGIKKQQEYSWEHSVKEHLSFFIEIHNNQILRNKNEN